jgi:Fe-S oxidoreductase
MIAQLTLFGLKLRSSISAPALDADFDSTIMRGRFYLDTVAVGCPFCMTMMATHAKDRATFA